VRGAGPELPLLDAAKIICNRSPNRVLKKFPRLIAAQIHLVPNGLPLAVGTSNAGLSYQCGFFLEAASGHRPAAYTVTITHTARCTYTAQTGVDNSDYSALDETYAETCASLG
jgi:hypothetical protein